MPNGTPNRSNCALRFSRQSLGNGRLGLKPVVSSWCDTATKSLGCQTGLCTHDLGGRSRNLFALSSLIPHRENPDLAQAGPSTDDNFWVQRPAQPFVSQWFQLAAACNRAHRNAIATFCFRLDKKWTRQAIWRTATAPHPGVSGGGGDGERSHGLKLNYS